MCPDDLDARLDGKLEEPVQSHLGRVAGDEDRAREVGGKGVREVRHVPRRVHVPGRHVVEAQVPGPEAVRGAVDEPRAAVDADAAVGAAVAVVVGRHREA